MNFFSIFIAVYAFTYAFLFFGGFGIFSNLFVAIAFFAFIVTVVIMAFGKQEEKSKELEKRIEMLEKKMEIQHITSDSLENM